MVYKGALFLENPFSTHETKRQTKVQASAHGVFTGGGEGGGAEGGGARAAAVRAAAVRAAAATVEAATAVAAIVVARSAG